MIFSGIVEVIKALSVIGGVAAAIGVTAYISHLGRQSETIPVPQKPTRLVQAVNEGIWNCLYCTLENVKDAVFCVMCGSPRELSLVVAT